jgi:hypothetical protein
MTIKTALLDADVINYQAASSAQRDYGTEIWSDIKGAIADAETQIQKEMEQAGCNRVLLVYSPKTSTNWRKLVMPAYKMHRKATPKPICYQELRTELEKRFDHISIDWLEGDDLFAMLADKIPNSVVVSIDKDMHTLPDIEYLRPHVMAWPVQQSKDFADHYWLYQVLIGDSTDGYKGLQGCGPKGAEKLLAPFMDIGIDDDGQSTHTFDFDGAWSAVVAAYRAKGQDNYLEQAQMARILRVGDYDSKLKRIRLFNPEEEQWLQLPTKD